MREEERDQTNEERDIVEFSDDEGNTLLLEVLDYFFYNGEEFAVLGDAKECCCDDEDCDEDHECEHSLYIMRVINSTNDDGEEMEEFVPVEEALMDQLVEVVQMRFSDDDDDDDDCGCDDDDCDCDDCDCDCNEDEDE